MFYERCGSSSASSSEADILINNAEPSDTHVLPHLPAGSDWHSRGRRALGSADQSPVSENSDVAMLGVHENLAGSPFSSPAHLPQQPDNSSGNDKQSEGFDGIGSSSRPSQQVSVHSTVPGNSSVHIAVSGSPVHMPNSESTSGHVSLPMDCPPSVPHHRHPSVSGFEDDFSSQDISAPRVHTVSSLSPSRTLDSVTLGVAHKKTGKKIV